MALTKMEKEPRDDNSCTIFPPPFLQALEDVRRILLGFSEGEAKTFNTDQASAMRIYASKKYGVSSRVSFNEYHVIAVHVIL